MFDLIFFSFSNMLCTMGCPFIVYPLSFMNDIYMTYCLGSLKGDPYCLIRINKVSKTWPMRGTSLP